MKQGQKKTIYIRTEGNGEKYSAESRNKNDAIAEMEKIIYGEKIHLENIVKV